MCRLAQTLGRTNTAQWGWEDEVPLDVTSTDALRACYERCRVMAPFSQERALLKHFPIMLAAAFHLMPLATFAQTQAPVVLSCQSKDDGSSGTFVPSKTRIGIDNAKKTISVDEWTFGVTPSEYKFTASDGTRVTHARSVTTWNDTVIKWGYRVTLEGKPKTWLFTYSLDRITGALVETESDETKPTKSQCERVQQRF